MSHPSGSQEKEEVTTLIDKENEETTQLYLWGTPCPPVHLPKQRSWHPH